MVILYKRRCAQAIDATVAQYSFVFSLSNCVQSTWRKFVPLKKIIGSPCPPFKTKWVFLKLVNVPDSLRMAFRYFRNVVNNYSTLFWDVYILACLFKKTSLYLLVISSIKILKSLQRKGNPFFLKVLVFTYFPRIGCQIGIRATKIYTHSQVRNTCKLQ